MAFNVCNSVDACVGGVLAIFMESGINWDSIPGFCLFHFTFALMPLGMGLNPSFRSTAMSFQVMLHCYFSSLPHEYMAKIHQ